jgi:hypothetical protein
MELNAMDKGGKMFKWEALEPGMIIQHDSELYL